MDRHEGNGRMNHDESDTERNVRIATLTGDAVRMPSETMAEALRKLVATAEETTKQLAMTAEAFILEYEKNAEELANRINTHVVACQAAHDSIKPHIKGEDHPTLRHGSPLRE